MLATGLENTQTAKLLIAKGADVNAANNDGANALIWASARGDIQTAELLIENGADVNATKKDDSSALTWASARG